MAQGSGTSFQLVRAGADHLPVVAPLFDAYRQFYQQPPAPAASAAFMRERLERGDSVVFLAFDEEGPARRGLGFTQLYPTFSSVRLGRLWILNDLYVAPEARRRGVAQALLDRAAALGRETGALALQLETAQDNGPAKTLYEARGWRRETRWDLYELAL